MKKVNKILVIATVLSLLISMFAVSSLASEETGTQATVLSLGFEGIEDFSFTEGVLQNKVRKPEANNAYINVDSVHTDEAYEGSFTYKDNIYVNGIVPSFSGTLPDCFAPIGTNVSYGRVDIADTLIGNHYFKYSLDYSTNNGFTPNGSFNFVSDEMTSYAYFMVDLDIMTDSVYTNNFVISLVGTTNDEEPKELEAKVTVKSSGDDIGLFLGEATDPICILKSGEYEWTHLTFVVVVDEEMESVAAPVAYSPVASLYSSTYPWDTPDVEEEEDDEEITEVNKSRFIVYKDGIYQGESIGLFSTAYATLNGVKWSLPAKTDHNGESSVCLDNLSVKTYSSDYTGGFASVINNSEKTLKDLPESYLNDESYESPIGRTLAIVDGVHYDNIADAIAVLEEGDTLEICDNVFTPVLIDKNISVNTNGFEFLPYSKTYQIYKDENGVYHTIKAYETMKTVWHSRDGGVAHSADYTAGSMPVYSGNTGDIYFAKDSLGNPLIFLGWSYAKGGEVITEDMPITVSELGDVRHYFPIYQAVDAKYAIVEPSGKYTLYTEDIDLSVVFSSASDGVEIVLLSDVAMAKSAVVPKGKTLKLNLNGYKIFNGTSANLTMFSIGANATLDVYSREAGAVINAIATGASSSNEVFNVYGNNATLNIGKGNDNLSVYAALLVQSGDKTQDYKINVNIDGGSYHKTGAGFASFLFIRERVSATVSVKNATVVMYNKDQTFAEFHGHDIGEDNYVLTTVGAVTRENPGNISTIVIDGCTILSKYSTSTDLFNVFGQGNVATITNSNIGFTPGIKIHSTAMNSFDKVNEAYPVCETGHGVVIIGEGCKLAGGFVVGDSNGTYKNAVIDGPYAVLALDATETVAVTLSDGTVYNLVLSHGIKEVDYSDATYQVIRGEEVLYKFGELAFGDLKSGDIVKLLKDISLSATVNLNGGKNISLDLNGHSITNGKNANMVFFMIYANCTFNVYSSQVGGRIDAIAPGMTTSSEVFHIGANNVTLNLGAYNGADGDNLSIICGSLMQALNKTADIDVTVNVDGGHYYKNGTNSMGLFILRDRASVELTAKNADFVFAVKGHTLAQVFGHDIGEDYYKVKNGSAYQLSTTVNTKQLSTLVIDGCNLVYTHNQGAPNLFDVFGQGNTAIITNSNIMMNPCITGNKPLSNLFQVNGAYTNFEVGHGSITIGEGCQLASSFTPGDTNGTYKNASLAQLKVIEPLDAPVDTVITLSDNSEFTFTVNYGIGEIDLSQVSYEVHRGEQVIYRTGSLILGDLESGDIIKLLKDVPLTSTVTLNGGKNIYIDLNGYAITNGTSGNLTMFLIYSNCTLNVYSSVPGGKIDGVSSAVTTGNEIFHIGANNVTLNLGAINGADGDNLSIYCASLVQALNKTADIDVKINIDGGYYYKTGTNSMGMFILRDRASVELTAKNADFVFVNGGHTFAQVFGHDIGEDYYKIKNGSAYELSTTVNTKQLSTLVINGCNLVYTHTAAAPNLFDVFGQGNVATITNSNIMFKPAISNNKPLSNLFQVNGAYTNFEVGYGEIIIGEGCQFTNAVQLGTSSTDNLPALKDGIEIVDSTATEATLSYSYVLKGVEYTKEVVFTPVYESKESIAE